MPARQRINRRKVGREIMLKMELDSRRPKNEVSLKTKAEAKAVADYWRYVAWPAAAGVPPAQMPDHGYETGSYMASINVEQVRDKKGRFAGGKRGISGRVLVAAWQVITRHPHANFIEFGTGVDKPGSKSPWGPNTPTPEFGPASSTAHHFRGTAP